jgi:hypothetical protein
MFFKPEKRFNLKLETRLDFLHESLIALPLKVKTAVASTEGTSATHCLGYTDSSCGGRLPDF